MKISFNFENIDSYKANKLIDTIKEACIESEYCFFRDTRNYCEDKFGKNLCEKCLEKFLSINCSKNLSEITPGNIFIYEGQKYCKCAKPENAALNLSTYKIECFSNSVEILQGF